MDLAASEKLARDLSAKDGKDAVIDAAGVEIMGAHCVQTILVARAAWQRAGNSLAVVNLPAAVEDQLRMLGLTAADLCTREDAA